MPTLRAAMQMLEEEPVSSVRAQSAVIRTLVDAIERLNARGDAAEGLREQLVEELARLQQQQAANVVAR